MIDKIAQKKLVLRSRMGALFFAILGIVPLELFIPVVAAIWSHKLFIFSVLSIYFFVYVVFLTKSLRVLWIFDRKTLRSLKITNCKIGQVGKMFVSAIEWARMFTYKENWNVAWKVIYFLFLIILGCLPFFVKFGIGICVIRKNMFSYFCLILGTIIRAYVLVYVGADVFNWLFGS